LRAMESNNLREGDYIETLEHLIFSVKGLFHPEGRTVAYLRYVPDLNGERKRKDGMRFRRVYELRDTTNYLRKYFPKYLYSDEKSNMILQAVPNVLILRTYKPVDGWAGRENSQSELAGIAVRFIDTLCKEARVPTHSIGVSGSLLLGLAGPSSDIDLVAYGSQHCLRVYEALRQLRVRGDQILPYDEHSVMIVLKERWQETGLDLGKMAKTEMNKILHGVIDQRGYFIRLVKDWDDENDGTGTFEPLGSAIIRAEIVDDQDSIFTPCSYMIKNCRYLIGSATEPVKELVSFRGKFAEQAKKGDLMEARGKLERVLSKKEGHIRLLLGSPKDYLIAAG